MIPEPSVELEDGEITGEEIFEFAKDIPINCGKEKRPICRLFKSNMCYRRKCPFRHVNADGSDYNPPLKVFDLSQAQTDFISQVIIIALYLYLGVSVKNKKIAWKIFSLFSRKSHSKYKDRNLSEIKKLDKLQPFVHATLVISLLKNDSQNYFTIL